MTINTNENFLKTVKLSTSFENLQFLEKQQKFEEAGSHSKFFRKGISGEWKKKLSNKEIGLTKVGKDLSSIPPIKA